MPRCHAGIDRAQDPHVSGKLDATSTGSWRELQVDYTLIQWVQRTTANEAFAGP